MKQMTDIGKQLKAWVGYAAYTLILLLVGITFYFSGGTSSAVTMVILTASVVVGISYWFDYKAATQQSR